MSLPTIKKENCLRYAQKVDFIISDEPRIDESKLEFLKKLKRDRFQEKLKKNHRMSHQHISIRKDDHQ